MKKLLIICGPTATGKTSFALSLSRHLPLELVSADSRQVYRGMDLITGKDIPPAAHLKTSDLKWRGQSLVFYQTDITRLWLYDIVNPDQPFNLSFYKQCADIVIHDIHSRSKLPAVVGGTGLYLKSFTHSLPQAEILPNNKLRDELRHFTASQLYNYLHNINPKLSLDLNSSDRKNPRRLLRAIEISLHTKSNPKTSSALDSSRFDFFILGLTAPKSVLQQRISQRVKDRIASGALAQAKHYASIYSSDLPALSASGFKALNSTDPISHWITLEYQYAKHQLTWFKKQSGIHWLDITSSSWQETGLDLILNWYNNSNVQTH